MTFFAMPKKPIRVALTFAVSATLQRQFQTIKSVIQSGDMACRGGANWIRLGTGQSAFVCRPATGSAKRRLTYRCAAAGAETLINAGAGDQPGAHPPKSIQRPRITHSCFGGSKRNDRHVRGQVAPAGAKWCRLVSKQHQLAPRGVVWCRLVSKQHQLAPVR
jgi:hypothetical protein